MPYGFIMRRNVLQVTLVHVAIMNIFDKIKFKKHSFKAIRQTFECFKLTFIYTLLVPMPTSVGRILHQVDINTYIVVGNLKCLHNIMS